MLVEIVLVLGLCLGLDGGPIDENPSGSKIDETPAAKDRTLYIRSLPGYPGERSDLYEVYMEPYYFVSF